MEKQLIPSDILIYDILTRVPPISLVRFRCVCKNWSKLFTHNPLFVALHCQKYNKFTSSGFIGATEDHALVFINHYHKKKTVLPLPAVYKILHHVEQSLNGFLLLKFHSGKGYGYSYFLYNPVTGYAFNIPIPVDDLAYPNGSPQFLLCYDRVVEKHKVIFCGPYKRDAPEVRKFKILTVGDGFGDKVGCNNVPWRDIVVPSTFEVPGASRYIESCPFTCLDNSLYWIAKPYSDKAYVASLDIHRELFNQIKPPQEGLILGFDAYLNDMGGALCLSHLNHLTKELNIWALTKKNHGYEEDDHEWVETFNIDLNRILGDLSTSGLQRNIFGPFSVLRDPKLKIIFGHNHTKVTMDRRPCNGYQPKQWVRMYRYYSYDIELKQLEIIYGPTEMHAHLHVHTIGHC